MSQDNIEIGQQLRKYRKAAGYTQEQVAAYSGVTNEYISRIELGKENPTINLLARICKAINIELKDLFLEKE